ncbi:MAG: sigma-70 family RNA polymerase sigma factor [Planctomycetes bacterium]|nr:sigma-70 family RNA polymerase sigma factor [Planctomycetota bacterium]
MVTTSDSLLERLRLPDADAWVRFVELYTPFMHRWACRLGLQDADADDLVQDVFGILLQKLPDFEYDPGRSFRGWLRTVLVHRWHNWPRRGEVLLTADLPGSDPGDEVQEEEYRCYLVARALKIMQTDFEPPTWKACWECVVNGRLAAEVADELGMSVAGVYIARSRVLRRLRDELRGMIEE